MPSPVQIAIQQKNQGKRVTRTPRAATNLSASRRLERQFEKVLTRIIQVIVDDLNRRLIPVLPEFVRDIEAERRPAVDRVDQNIARRLADILAATRVTFRGRIPAPEIEARIRDQGFEVAADNSVKISQMFRTALGVDLFLDEPFIENALGNYTAETTALIRNVSEEFIDQSERVVLQGLRRGIRHEEIAKQLVGLKDKDGKPSLKLRAMNRAKLIARDQTNKLNGKLTELRQASAGIREYIWRTVGDDRVRPEHRALNGKKFSWDDPPSVGHPGEPVNCRCFGEPVFDV